MPAPAPAAPRRFRSPDGAEWEARLLPGGRPSPYLAARLARPLVEFRRLVPLSEARLYAALHGSALEELSDAALLALWRQARPS
jgi:hypothetical protein